MAVDVIMNFKKGGGSSLEVLYGDVTLTPTLLHTLSGTAVLPASTKRDLIDGQTTFPQVAPTPAPVDGQIEWGYVVRVADNFGHAWEYIVGVPDVVGPINFVDLPRYFETRPPAYGIGPAGPAGQSATIQVGTVGSGVEPSVVNSGTPTNAVLDFTLQQGPVGPTGAGVPEGGSALQIVRKNADNTTTEWATLDKALIGLGNVDNTSDANKPVSTAQATAIADVGLTIAVGTKNVADLPSTYPNGTSITRAGTSLGWPNVRTDGGASDVSIVTLKSKSANGGITQFVRDYYREFAPLMVRYSNTSNNWSAFATIGTQEYVASRTPLNFLDHGGVADGVTDNSLALTDFIIKLSNEKRIGFVPNGDYILKSTVVAPADSADWGLRGESKTNTRFLFRPSGVPSSATVLTGIGVTNMSLENLHFDGGHSIHAVRGHTISFRNATGCLIENSHIRDHGYAAVILFALNEDAGVYGRNIVRNTDAEGLNNSDNGFLFVNMEGCHFINVTARGGGKNAWNTPSSGIQFKNRTTNSHMVNVASYGYKDGIGLGGDTDNFGPTNNTVEGYAYNCHISLSMGSAVSNRIRVVSSGATQNDVRLAANCADNFVEVSIDATAKSESPIYFGSNFNTVTVKYLPNGITNLATFIVASRYNKLLVESRYASSGQNITGMITNLSEYTSNYVGTYDSLYRTNSLIADGTGALYFNDPSQKQNYIAHQGSSKLFSFRSDGVNIFTMDPSIMGPGTDNITSLGSSTRRFTQLYATNGTINTSDEREKRDITTNLEPELRAWAKIDFVKFKWREAVDLKGAKARWHFGVLAQDVKRAFESEGLDPFEYGILCYDSWVDSDAVLDDNGEEVKPAQKAGDRYGVRYDEAMALEVAYLRSQLVR